MRVRVCCHAERPHETRDERVALSKIRFAFRKQPFQLPHMLRDIIGDDGEPACRLRQIAKMQCLLLAVGERRIAN